MPANSESDGIYHRSGRPARGTILNVSYHETPESPERNAHSGSSRLRDRKSSSFSDAPASIQESSERHDGQATPNHSGKPNGQKKRSQVRHACVNCQKSCKKCEEVRPCARCVKYGMEATCVDSVRKDRKRSRGSSSRNEDVGLVPKQDQDENTPKRGRIDSGHYPTPDKDDNDSDKSVTTESDTFSRQETESIHIESVKDSDLIYEPYQLRKFEALSALCCAVLDESCARQKEIMVQNHLVEQKQLQMRASKAYFLHQQQQHQLGRHEATQANQHHQQTWPNSHFFLSQTRA